MVRAAAKERAEALVIECMALNPGLQSVCERKLVRSTHGVITNSRADHLDVMGPTVVDVARALAGTTPVGGKLFTAEQTHLNILREAAADRGSQLIAVDDEQVARVTWDELERFSYIEHPDNVALALKVCQDIGVDRDTALRGMWRSSPRPGSHDRRAIRRCRPAHSVCQRFCGQRPRVDRQNLGAGVATLSKNPAAHRRGQLPRGSSRSIRPTRPSLSWVVAGGPLPGHRNGHAPVRQAGDHVGSGAATDHLRGKQATAPVAQHPEPAHRPFRLGDGHGQYRQPGHGTGAILRPASQQFNMPRPAATTSATTTATRRAA